MTQSSDGDIDIPDEMDFEQSLEFAVRLLRENRLDAAEPLIELLLEAAPEHPDLLHFLAILKFRRGHNADALVLMRKAISLVPEFPDFHLNLGNILAEQGDIDGALAEFEETRRLRPDSADAWNNLGSMYRASDRFDDAELAYARALELDPAHVGAHNNLGVLYSRRGDGNKAFDFFCKAIVLSPEHTESYKLLGASHVRLGQLAQAAEIYRRWIEVEPENPVPRHHLAACQGSDAPERAPDGYVARTFDQFADSFEDLLQTRLHYRAPELISELLGRRLPQPSRQFDVLDAGCGTGLCGPLIAPWSRTLVGVDLSGGMLAKARNKNCYDHLHKAELTHFLREQAGAYDLILSADTLCYFGTLDAVSAAAAGALRPGGVLAFTVERLSAAVADTGFRLNPSGRYEHSPEYVSDCLGRVGLAEIRIENAHLRSEARKPVEGLVVIARRPASASASQVAHPA